MSEKVVQFAVVIRVRPRSLEDDALLIRQSERADAGVVLSFHSCKHKQPFPTLFSHPIERFVVLQQDSNL